MVGFRTWTVGCILLEIRMSFETDIDWEELAIKLIRENKRLKQELQEFKQEEVVDWSDRLAPQDAGYPVLLTLCAPDERLDLLRRARQKIVGGKWVGTLQGKTADGGRPCIKYEPRLMKQQEARGERPRKKSIQAGKKGVPYEMEPHFLLNTYFVGGKWNVSATI